MKANEFVKKFGWDEVISELSKTQDSVVVIWLGSQSNDYALVKDLKRLVVSHQLVGSYGGLESSKLTVNYPNFLNDKDIKTTNHRLSKAIADVESCL